MCMDIRDALAKNHSREQAEAIADFVGGSPERFAELMRLFLSGEYRVVQRSAWAVAKIVEREPKLVAPYLSRLVVLLEDETAHPAAHRNILRLLQTAPIPAKYEGRLYDICLSKIDDPAAATAVRAFAIEVAARIANGEPDLLAEIRLVTMRHLKDAKAAIRSKARNVLKIVEEN